MMDTKSIIDFIENNFQVGYKKEYLKNIKKLVMFLEGKGTIKNKKVGYFFDLSLEDAGVLLDGSEKLNKTMEYISYSKDNKDIFDDINIYKIYVEYAKRNKIPMMDETQEEVAFEKENKSITTEKRKREYSIIEGDNESYYRHDVSQFDILTPEGQEYYGKILLEGNPVQKEMARNKLVECNLGLVKTIARRYSDKGLEYLDLIQEGNMGLLRAAEKFDYTQGYLFSTYASIWIRQAIMRALCNKGKKIRIPVHMCELYNKVYNYKRGYKIDHGRSPSIDEIANELGISRESVQKVLTLPEISVSTDQNLNDDEDSNFTFNDIITDGFNLEESSIDIMFSSKLITFINECNFLKEKEKQILFMRYGVGRKGEMKLEEIGKEFGISRERVRQIVNNTLSKLQKNFEFRKQFAVYDEPNDPNSKYQRVPKLHM